MFKKNQKLKQKTMFKKNQNKKQKNKIVK